MAARTDPGDIQINAAPDEVRPPEEIARELGVNLDLSEKASLVLIGPSGAFKSSTGNQLCGQENPQKDLEGRELAEAREAQIFKNSPYDDEEGDSVTEECKDHDGRWYYVVDTPGFGDTGCGGDSDALTEKDRLTALRIVQFLRTRNRGVTGFVFFINQLLTRRDAWLQVVFKHLLLNFDNPQDVLDHLIIAHPVMQQADVESKGPAVEKSCSIVKSTLRKLLPELQLNDCVVPDPLPYACFCPFADPDAGGSLDKTMRAFDRAIERVQVNVLETLTAPRDPAQHTFKPKFPKGKCMYCSYNRPERFDAQACVLTESEMKCHPDIKAFAKWEKVVGGIFKVLLAVTVVPLLIPSRLWPSFITDDFWCRKCKKSCQSPGCTEPPEAKHKFMDDTN